MDTKNQYVIFRLGPENFCLKMEKVKAIIGFQETVTLPGSGRFIEGIVQLKGEAIPVFNLRRKIGFPETIRTKNSRIIVIKANESAVALVADQIFQVVAICDSLFQASEDILIPGVDQDFIEGITWIQEKLVILLDLDVIFSQYISKAI